MRKFIAKIRIYDIADQDKIAGWILQEFPGLLYVLSKSRPGKDKREAAFRGMYLQGDESLTSRDWIETHARKNHGPLGRSIRRAPGQRPIHLVLEVRDDGEPSLISFRRVVLERSD